MALIDTPASASANTYASVATADAYFATHTNASVWTAATTTNAMKEQALQTATRLIDALFTFVGEIASTTQALRWPRYGVYDQDGRLLASNTLPTRVVQATCELAMALLTKDRLKESVFNKYGLTSFKVGPLSAAASAAVRTTIVPDLVASLLEPYGDYTGESNPNSPKFLKVRRT